MQKWTSLLALTLLVGCAATPIAPGDFALDAAAPADKHVQQVFATPTPVPTTTLSPQEAAKANRLLDLCVAQLNVSLRELRTRLNRERDRNMINFARQDPYTGLRLSSAVLVTYRQGMTDAVTNLELDYAVLTQELALARSMDMLTVRKAIMKAKTDWYKLRLATERLGLTERTRLSNAYKTLQKQRRKALR